MQEPVGPLWLLASRKSHRTASSTRLLPYAASGLGFVPDDGKATSLGAPRVPDHGPGSLLHMERDRQMQALVSVTVRITRVSVGS